MRPASSCSCSYSCSGAVATCHETTRMRPPETVEGRAKDPIARIREESLRRAKAFPLSPASRTQNEPHAVELIPIKFGGNLVFYLSAAILANRGIQHFGEAATFRLNRRFPPSSPSGILPPGIGSTRTKNVPVPISGWVHREMTQPAILRFSMIGKGGPLCALAGNARSSASAAVATSRASGMGRRFGIVEKHAPRAEGPTISVQLFAPLTAAALSACLRLFLAAHQCGAHFHGLED
jgi:hypothetical protein